MSGIRAEHVIGCGIALCGIAALVVLAGTIGRIVYVVTHG